MRSSNAVLQSAFVLSPTLPTLNRESHWSRYNVASRQACTRSATAASQAAVDFYATAAKLRVGADLRRYLACGARRRHR